MNRTTRTLLLLTALLIQAAAARAQTPPTPERTRALPFLYLDCGTEDFLLGTNRDFAALLVERKVPHEFRQLPGGHTWPYRDRQVREVLRLAAERVAAPGDAKAAGAR